MDVWPKIYDFLRTRSLFTSCPKTEISSVTTCLPRVEMHRVSEWGAKGRVLSFVVEQGVCRNFGKFRYKFVLVLSLALWGDVVMMMVKWCKSQYWFLIGFLVCLQCWWPFGSRVKVTNVETMHYMVVTILMITGVYMPIAACLCRWITKVAPFLPSGITFQLGQRLLRSLVFNWGQKYIFTPFLNVFRSF